MKNFQLNIFNEREELTHKSTNYADFVKKFKPQKTTDDCYTPPAVYAAVKEFVNDYIFELDGVRVLCPFRPGGDYLGEDYSGNCVVIDNPPFSIYTRIVRNYLRMGVKFFLFAPALSLFVLNSDCQYVITASNIIYENGARVRTSFATNLLHEGVKIRFSPILKNKIIAAQKQNVKTLKKMQMPENYFSSAQLLRYVQGEDFCLQGSNDFLTKINGRKIFGSAMRFTDTDLEILKNKKL